MLKKKKFAAKGKTSNTKCLYQDFDMERLSKGLRGKRVRGEPSPSVSPTISIDDMEQMRDVKKHGPGEDDYDMALILED